jgi:hypothetical protein
VTPAREVVARLLADDRVLDRVKVEDLLAVATGARPAAMVVVPAELPDGRELGAEIDRRFWAHMQGRDLDPYDPVARVLGKVVDRVRKKALSELKYKNEVLHNTFFDVLHHAASYLALREHAQALDLRVELEENRPTIQEFYILHNVEQVLDMREIGQTRRDLRHAALRRPQVYGPAYYRVFPEEASPEFGRLVGRVLGYPDCCIDRYGFDRSSVSLPVEVRASEQISKARAAGDEPDPYAYFTRDFFPCDPHCPQAAAIGHRVHAALGEVSEAAARLYERLLGENVQTVLEYPDVIRMHAHDLEQRARRAGGGVDGR